MTYGDKRYDNYTCDHCGAEWKIGGEYSPEKEDRTIKCRWCRNVLFSGRTRESFAEWEIKKEGNPSMKRDSD